MSPRKNLADFIPEAPAAPPAMPTRTAPAAEPAAPVTETQPAAAGRPAEVPAAPATARPSARDLINPVRPKVVREALKADVPADLALLRRLRSYRADQGMDIRDQVALAVDEWLSAQGY